eukprot:300673_1
MCDTNRDVVLTHLTHCLSHDSLESAASTIRTRLEEHGMRSIVIQGQPAFAYSGGGPTSWARFGCGNQEYTIFEMNYRPTNNDCIRCSDTGDMTDEHRNFVLNLLRYCSAHNTMEVGMKAVVVKDSGGFGYYSGVEAMEWSKWLSTKHGSMSADERTLVLNALTYCHSHETMSAGDVAKRLNDKGNESIVMKDNKGGFQYYGGGLNWSEWKSSKYGKYNVIFL